MDTLPTILSILLSDALVSLLTFVLTRRSTLRKNSAQADALVIQNDQSAFETYRQQIAYLNDQVFSLTRQLTDLRVSASALEAENRRLLDENRRLRGGTAPAEPTE